MRKPVQKKPAKKRPASKRPSSDPMVRARQLLQEHQDKVEQGATFWKPGDSARHVPSDEQPLPDVTLMPTPEQVSALMAAMGRKGGKIGGKRRLETMTAKERRESALRAAKARWGKGRKAGPN